MIEFECLVRYVHKVLLIQNFVPEHKILFTEKKNIVFNVIFAYLV
jgi:hypothetical protein